MGNIKEDSSGTKKMQREILTDPQTWSTRFRLSNISQNQTGEVYTLTILEQIT